MSRASRSWWRRRGIPGSIVLEDVGGTSLAGLAKPLAVDELIGLAVGLARAVAGMHRRGVMHRDITPANIVISRDGAPCLVDFALATSLAEIRPEFTHHTEIVGTLAYLAPEQTGRTGRSVDQRADLYALGATLYELATGAPPFGSGDPLRLTHDHLARVPVPPAEVNPAVPGAVVGDHHASAGEGTGQPVPDGRGRGLRPGAGAGRRPHTAAALRVGEHDVPLRLLPPSRLVGRDDEVAALEAAFEDALAGRCRGVLVGGAPGVGKTALVDELRPVVTGRDGWFVAGKFDQYRRDLEFDAVHQAFRALGRLLLAEPEDELAEVRGRILGAVGRERGSADRGGAGVRGAAGGAARSGGSADRAGAGAAQRRVEVLRAVASRKRPVVVFVDDLQWAGRTPLGFVDLVLSEEPVEGLLLVGAYRDGDVDAAHPLAAPLSRWRDQAGVRHLRLDNLPVPSLVAMVAEMLHVDPAAAAGLVELIDPYTSGNPYETVELLNALRRDGAADRDGRRVAVGRRGRARSPGPVRGGRAAGGAGRGPAGAVAAGGGGDGVSGRASRAEPAADRHRRAGRRGGAAAGARPRRGPAGGGARGARGGAVPPRPHPRGDPGAGWIRSGDAPCSWRWRGGWPRCRSCSRSRRSSTCRWSTRSTTPRSGVGWWGCCGAPPTRRR